MSDLRSTLLDVSAFAWKLDDKGRVRRALLASTSTAVCGRPRSRYTTERSTTAI
jgi:hypothetical protein